MTNEGEWHILWLPMLDQLIFGRWTLPRLAPPFLVWHTNLPLANWFSLNLVPRQQHLIKIALCFMVEIESKILRIVQEQIFRSIFLALAPNYTDQPEVTPEHVYQIFTDKDRHKSCCSVQKYYTHILAAMQPLIKEHAFPVNSAEKFTSFGPSVAPSLQAALSLAHKCSSVRRRYSIIRTLRNVVCCAGGQGE